MLGVVRCDSIGPTSDQPGSQIPAGNPGSGRLLAILAISSSSFAPNASGGSARVADNEFRRPFLLSPPPQCWATRTLRPGSAGCLALPVLPFLLKSTRCCRGTVLT